MTAKIIPPLVWSHGAKSYACYCFYGEFLNLLKDTMLST